MYLSAHLEILRNSIAIMDLKEFVDYHVKLISLAVKMNKLYYFIIFLECLVMSLLISVMAVIVMTSGDVAVLFTLGFYLISCITDLFIYCYGGQKIMDSAGDLCNEYYKLNKNYFTIMLRTSTDLKIKTFIFDASLSTITLILNWAMSLITFVKSFL